MLPHLTDRQSDAHKTRARSMRTCLRNGTDAIPLLRAQIKSTPVMWRPWVLAHREDGNHQDKLRSGRRMESSEKQLSGAKLGFRHPVRLCMPRSKAQEYLSHLGWKVLASFPVQATLHFYNDDSDSENEDEEVEEEHKMEEA